MSLMNCVKRMVCITVVLVLTPLFYHNEVFGQDDYLFNEEQQLQMAVHIIGEVKNPGEYLVPDDTNVIELLSKAKGPTQFSNLGSVTITRYHHNISSNGLEGNGKLEQSRRVIKLSLDQYLKAGGGSPPPILKPGDVVFVPRNAWSRWRNTATIIRDISVMASLYFLYLRATD